MIEFRLLAGIGRSGVMIGRICLDMVSQLLDGAELFQKTYRFHQCKFTSIKV